MRFSFQTAAFVCRFLLTHCELIHKLGYLGNTTTPATRRNSQFPGSISRLARIFVGKMRKNNLNNPTSRSHNFSVWTPIRANFISLESILLKLSKDTLHDPFWVSEGLQKLPQNLGQKTIQTRESRMICRRCHVVDKIATWKPHVPSSSTLHDAASPWVWSRYKSDPPPPLLQA